MAALPLLRVLPGRSKLSFALVRSTDLKRQGVLFARIDLKAKQMLGLFFNHKYATDPTDPTDPADAAVAVDCVMVLR